MEGPHLPGTEACSDEPLLSDDHRYRCRDIARYFGNLEETRNRHHLALHVEQYRHGCGQVFKMPPLENLLTIIRPIAAITVACLASFRQLFIKSEQAGLQRQSESLRLCERGLVSSLRSPKPVAASGRKILSTQEKDPEGEAVSSQNSTSSELPIDAIYVRRDVSIFSEVESYDMPGNQVNHHSPWSLPAPIAYHNLLVE